MEKFEKLKDLVAATEIDAAKFYGKSNSSAGTRVRKAMLVVKKLASEIRKEVTEKKNARKH